MALYLPSKCPIFARSMLFINAWQYHNVCVALYIHILPAHQANEYKLWFDNESISAHIYTRAVPMNINYWLSQWHVNVYVVSKSRSQLSRWQTIFLLHYYTSSISRAQIVFVFLYSLMCVCVLCTTDFATPLVIPYVQSLSLSELCACLRVCVCVSVSAHRERGKSCLRHFAIDSRVHSGPFTYVSHVCPRNSLIVSDSPLFHPQFASIRTYTFSQLPLSRQTNLKLNPYCTIVIAAVYI